MAIQWSNWATLGKPPETEIGKPFVQSNQDGRLEVFAVGQGEIFNISQVSPNGGWSDGWRSKGRPSSEVGIKSHVVGRNADGRLAIFALGGDNAIWQKWQVAPNSGWVDTWKTLGLPFAEPALRGFTEQFTVRSNQDGRQELFAAFAVEDFREAWHNWQTVPNGGWSGWRMLSGIFPEDGPNAPSTAHGGSSIGIRGTDRITAGRNEDGRLELFVIADDDVLWHIWQLFPNAHPSSFLESEALFWSRWDSLGKPRDAFPEPKDRDLFQPVVQQNADGHLEVFAPGNGAFCNRWQERPLNLPGIKWRSQGWNAKPKPRPEVGLTWLEAVLNVSGPLRDRIEVLALGDDGALWHAWQIDQAPNWSHWESLGSPPSKIRAADHLTIGTNQDGRLEVFLVGQDGAVWHTWQIR